MRVMAQSVRQAALPVEVLVARRRLVRRPLRPVRREPLPQPAHARPVQRRDAGQPQQRPEGIRAKDAPLKLPVGAGEKHRGEIHLCVHEVQILQARLRLRHRVQEPGQPLSLEVRTPLGRLLVHYQPPEKAPLGLEEVRHGNPAVAICVPLCPKPRVKSGAEQARVDGHRRRQHILQVRAREERRRWRHDGVPWAGGQLFLRVVAKAAHPRAHSPRVVAEACRPRVHLRHAAQRRARAVLKCLQATIR
mmetsp:Transcript_36305/g.117374  ORF Transcript_36305/g.117374 Transcript_36305/m.117374 type:complete len:248 (-) Transcript_36305:2554-3297(-)